MVTLSPRASSSAPIDAAASPLPRDDTTPPVTKMYLGGKLPLLPGWMFDARPSAHEGFFVATLPHIAVEPCVTHRVQRRRHVGARGHPEGDHVVAAQPGAGTAVTD